MFLLHKRLFFFTPCRERWFGYSWLSFLPPPLSVDTILLFPTPRHYFGSNLNRCAGELEPLFYRSMAPRQMAPSNHVGWSRGRWRKTHAPTHRDVHSRSLKTVKHTCDGTERASIARFPLGVAVVYFRGLRVEPLYSHWHSSHCSWRFSLCALG